MYIDINYTLGFCVFSANRVLFYFSNFDQSLFTDGHKKCLHEAREGIFRI